MGLKEQENGFFWLLPSTNPVLQHSITPCPPASPEPARHLPEAKPMADGRSRWRAGARHKFSAIKDTVISIGCRNSEMSRREASALAKGTVKWFSKKKGYGFIEQDGGQDIFVHYSSIDMPGFKTLNEGDQVTFEVEVSDRGPEAKNVRKS